MFKHVSIVAALGLMTGCFVGLGRGRGEATPGDGGTSDVNALNGYGKPTDDKLATYFDSALKGPTAEDSIGRIPADLSSFDFMDETFDGSAMTSPNTMSATYRFESLDGSRLCFSDLILEEKASTSQDDIIERYRDAGNVIFAFRDRADLGDRKIWPLEGQRLDDITITSDEIEDKDTEYGIKRVRKVSVALCGNPPVDLAGAQYLAVAVHDDSTGESYANGLLLWKLIRR
jgi:hypothetical protein